MRRWTIWVGVAAGLAIVFAVVYFHVGAALWPEPMPRTKI